MMCSGSVGRHASRFLICWFWLFCGTGLVAEAVVSDLDEVASMGEPIEEGCGHLCFGDDPRPFAEAEIGRDEDARALVELAQQLVQQPPPRRYEKAGPPVRKSNGKFH